MYRRLLVPVDGSPTSLLGLRHALGLARDQGAVVRVLNVVDEMIMAPMADGYAVADMSSILDSMRETGRKALEEAVALGRDAKVKTEAAMLEARGHRVSDVILAQAKKFGADLIVMGTHGRRGLNRLLLGSDAERVLRDASMPVLLVRQTGSARRKQGTKRKTAGRNPRTGAAGRSRA